ncbi:gliding motility-associated C-terminal domain-containing protein [Taibaiella chishuiensis]|nr:gliding motility-associated C-terminal domain-containing protein [Taibaiella chishuiensis]
MSRFFKTWMLVLLVSIPAALYAQLLPPDRPEQDACGALSLCGNSFTTPYGYQGIGNKSDLPNTPCASGEANSMWLKLKVTAPGIIVFTITPAVVTDDYDFAIVNATNQDCNNLGTGPLSVIRCNFNNNSPVTNNGVVGLNLTSNALTVTSGANNQHFLRRIDASAGDTYLIMINNFGGAGGPSSGFTIDFTGSTATFDNGPSPRLVSLTQTCNTKNEVLIQLSEEVKCNSIAPNGSDFMLVPGGTIAGASGINCNASNQGYTDKIRVTFSPALAPGNYRLRAKTGTDGNTLLDLCNNQLALPDSLTFRVYNLDTTVTRTICPAQLPYTWNGIVVTAGGNNVAQFHKTSVIGGCDSLTRLNLVVTNVITATVNRRICPFQMPYTWNGIVVTTPGPAAAVYNTVNAAGCDSVATLNLSVQVAANQSLTMSGCGKVVIRGNTYTQSQIVKDTIVSSIGCDSLYRTINVVVHPVNPTTIVKDTAGCGKVVFNGVTYTQSITLRDTVSNQFGCDSIYHIVHIIVYPNEPARVTNNVGDCDVVSFEGNKYLNDTTLVDTFRNWLGCDSLVRTTVIYVERFKMKITADPPQPVKGDYVLFTTEANVSGYRVNAWFPPDFFNNQFALSNSTLLPRSDTVKVVGQSPLGCVDTAILYIKADSLIPVVIMPNAFSPNGDGLNDVFEPKFVNKSGYVVKFFRVFNRWGQLVYKAEGTRRAAWDGYYYNKDQKADADTYYYIVSVEFIDGTKETIKGDVVLLR